MLYTCASMEQKSKITNKKQANWLKKLPLSTAVGIINFKKVTFQDTNKTNKPYQIFDITDDLIVRSLIGPKEMVVLPSSAVKCDLWKEFALKFLKSLEHQ